MCIEFIGVRYTHSELLRVLLSQEIGVLLTVILVSGWVVWHEVVVQIVVASHSHEEQAPSERACHVIGAEVFRDLIQSRLEVYYIFF